MMVGTSPAGKGGVASVVRLYRESGFLERQDIQYRVSHVGSTDRVKLGSFVAVLLELLKHVLTGRLALLHAQSASRSSFKRKSVLLAVARTGGARTIFHLHGAEFRQFYEQEAGALLRWWIRYTLQASSAVFVLSARWSEFIHAIAPRARVEVVANPVVLDQLISSDAKAEELRVLFLGRADRRKGVFELISAISRLTRRYPGLRLAIGGDGDLEGVRRAAAELGVLEQVDILGWINPDQRRQEFARSTVFALPSYDEGLPMAMLEAMAAGKAIVTTPVGGIPDAIADGEDGLLVQPGNVDELVAALDRLLAEPELRAELGQNARAKVMGRYAANVVFERLDQLYAGILQPGA